MIVKGHRKLAVAYAAYVMAVYSALPLPLVHSGGAG